MASRSCFAYEVEQKTLSQSPEVFQLCGYVDVWGIEYVSLCACVCKHDRIYIEGASIYLFWMQIKLQQSFVDTLLLGNTCLLCNLVGLLDIVCDGTVCLLD